MPVDPIRTSQARQPVCDVHLKQYITFHIRTAPETVVTEQKTPAVDTFFWASQSSQYDPYHYHELFGPLTFRKNRRVAWLNLGHCLSMLVHLPKCQDFCLNSFKITLLSLSLSPNTSCFLCLVSFLWRYWEK